MRGRYLGDSYDLVKRIWAENLISIGTLYAHPKFVPSTIRDQFTAVTLMPILDPAEPPEGPYGVFLDPHMRRCVGIPGSDGGSECHLSEVAGIRATERLF